ncbi:MAG TPA: hypothetical protein VF590_06475 [Isosphaeraceae bacterium]|jgi:hypothetical protein
MAEIVLVHGIAQEQLSADLLESVWLPALAGGVRTARFPAVADRLWRAQGGPGGIDARMAFHGHLFLRPGAQGIAPRGVDARAGRSGRGPGRRVAGAGRDPGNVGRRAVGWSGPRASRSRSHQAR